MKGGQGEWGCSASVLPSSGLTLARPTGTPAISSNLVERVQMYSMGLEKPARGQPGKVMFLGAGTLRGSKAWSPGKEPTSHSGAWAAGYQRRRSNCFAAAPEVVFSVPRCGQQGNLPKGSPAHQMTPAPTPKLEHSASQPCILQFGGTARRPGSSSSATSSSRTGQLPFSS